MLDNPPVNQFLFHDIPNWLHANQTIVGCIIIGVGTIVVALSGILKSKGDKAAASRKKEENAKSTRRYVDYVLVLLVGCAISAYGTWVTKRAGEDAAKAESKRAVAIQQETDGRIAKMQLEFGEKFQAVLVKLNAAKHEDSKKITEEKIRVIQSDLSQWAESFVTNLPTRKNQLIELKAGFQKEQAEKSNIEIQRQVQVTGQAYPALSFAIRFVQESVRVYAKRTGKDKDIVINPMELPENFYEKPTTSEIHFATNAVWKLSVTTAGRPQNMSFISDRLPYLRITFIDVHGQQAGMFCLRPQSENQKISASYTASLPTPDPATINGEHNLLEYESVTRNSLQRIIEAQLLQTEEQ